jgi:SP family facilitated glucose transporter-like MFS transporter 1
MPLGGVFGGLSSGYFADNFGRKSSLILINILVIITACLNIMSKYASSIETLMAGIDLFIIVHLFIYLLSKNYFIGRFIIGLYSGLFSGVVPMYLSEIGEKFMVLLLND